ncbi:MAG: outer membrane beta-barrel protein [Muribaculaceae bacterium]|nr:outer membrane beta-barrel protein [Muribaculaceae bacterium]
MKKFLLLCVLGVLSLSASAQIYLGGTFGLDRDFTNNTTDFAISPEIGYNINDTWGVGGTISYQYRYEDGLKANVFDLSPYVRWTFARVVDDKLHFFVDGGFGIGLGDTKYRTLKSDTLCIWSIGFKPGVSFSFNNHWTILTHIGFLGYNGANDAAKEVGFTNNFGLDFSSLNLNFGVYYTF